VHLERWSRPIPAVSSSTFTGYFGDSDLSLLLGFRPIPCLGIQTYPSTGFFGDSKLPRSLGIHTYPSSFLVDVHGVLVEPGLAFQASV
jgi:hypothetical protein